MRESIGSKAKFAGALGILAADDANRDRIREEGGIQLLIGLLRDGSESDQGIAASALGILATNSNNRGVIREEGGVRHLVWILKKGSEQTQANVVYALGNLAMDGRNRDSIRDSGGIIPLINVVNAGSQEAQANAACALHNLAASEENELMIKKRWAIWPMFKTLHNVSCPQANIAGPLQFLKANAENEDVIREEGGPKPPLKTQGGKSGKPDDDIIDAFLNLRLQKMQGDKEEVDLERNEDRKSVTAVPESVSQGYAIDSGARRGRHGGRGGGGRQKSAFLEQIDLGNILVVVISAGIVLSCGINLTMRRFRFKACRWRVRSHAWLDCHLHLPKGASGGPLPCAPPSGRSSAVGMHPLRHV